MKKIMLSGLLALGVSAAAQAQKISSEKVPAAVTKAFALRYPTVKTVEWEKEDGNYEAGFKIDGVEYSVLLDATGNITETENEIPTDKLPAACLTYLSTNHPQKKIKEAAQIIDAGSRVWYEVELEHGDLIFDADGKFVKTVNK